MESKTILSKGKTMSQSQVGASKVSTSAVDINSDDDESEQIGKDVGKGRVAIDRDEYLQAHRELLFDKSQAQLRNNILQRRLADYYRKRNLEHVLKPIEGTTDLEEKYQQKLISYEELKDKAESEVAEMNGKIGEIQLQFDARLENAEKKFEVLQNHEKATGTGLIYSKKGKPMNEKIIQRFIHLQMRKSEQVNALRLRYIRARNAVADLESIIRKLERVGPGFRVARYEQLCIDNANYMNKIEEREDELIKNRGKCQESNQILAHIREKMHHTDEVIDTTENELGEAEIEYQRAREDLGVATRKHDKLRWNLQSEQAKAGLLLRKDLLRDFQDSQDALQKMRDKRDRYEYQINKNNMQLRDARRYLKRVNQNEVERVLDEDDCELNWFTENSQEVKNKKAQKNDAENSDAPNNDAQNSGAQNSGA